MRPSRLRAPLSFSSLVLIALLSASRADAQATQVKPWFLIVFDTSGSMTTSMPPNSCGYSSDRIGAAKCAVRNIIDSIGDAEFGFLQFAQDHDSSPSCNGTSCGQTEASAWLRVPIAAGNTSTMRALVDGSGTAPIDELCAAGYTPIGGSLDAARDYFSGTLDYTGGAGADASPTATDTYTACRPINVILLTDGAECCNSCATGGCPGPEAEFGAGFGTCATTCTDVPSCNGGNQHSETGPQRAHELYHSTTVPTPMGNLAKNIRTYSIGFGIAPGDARIERIARAGHTDNPDPSYYGFYADNEAALSAALNQIILESIKNEVCDGDDDDCDGRVDEGSARYCDMHGVRTSNGTNCVSGDPDGDGQTCLAAVSACPGGDCGVQLGENDRVGAEADDCVQSSLDSLATTPCNPPNRLCASPGELCDQSDDDCDGSIDENAPPSGGIDDCSLPPFDDDCDGLVDEDCTSECGPEICNGLDDDCDDVVDEDLARRCGTDVGACVSGTQTCVNGDWGAVDPMNPGAGWQLDFCPDTGPGTETCNNADDDCDGVIDRITQPCAPYGNTLECLPGIETCIGGVWQSSGPNPDNAAACIGAKGPTAEICDTKNNDCNTSTADGSQDTRVGVSCGNGKGICVPGLTVCTAGAIACNDVDEAVNEICDGLDNDCDGAIDEDTSGDPLPGAGDDCYPGMLPPLPMSLVGECGFGRNVCVRQPNGTAIFECQDWQGPTTEICDTLDNDCNASTPDGDDDPRVGQDCGTSTGECEPGTNICDASLLTNPNTWIVCDGGTDPVFEECDGRDNDCDFKTDEDLPDDDNDGMLDPDTSCDITGGLGDEGVCEFGQERCVQTGSMPNTFAIQCIGGVGPSTEVCDGEDNDCDGVIDECAGLPGQPAHDACVAGTVRGVDLGPLGAGGGDVCGSPIAPCATGLTKCVPDTTDLGNTAHDNPGYVCVGDIPGMPEVCNGDDDDCDTKVDEQLTDGWLGDECSDDPAGDPVLIPGCREPADGDEPCGRCQFGLYGCVDGEQVCNGAVGQATYESCNGADDDCDGVVDECVDPTGANCRNVGEIDPETPVGSECAAGACMSGINACKDGKLVCEGSETGGDEICNNLDDDCDGSVDEGFNKGAPCTESGEPAVGECKPGTLVCDLQDGDTKCVGEKTGGEEICNSLDDDCDRIVDEGTDVGEECGTDEGLCEPGKLVCVSGRTVCDGQVAPAPEVCDCADNDCDGEIDEGTGGDPVCPAVGGVASACIMCQCALPCVQQEEFDRMCPQGKSAVDDANGDCFCVGEQCKALECQTETIDDADGNVQCAPDSTDVGDCVCKNNECTFRCKGVSCAEGLACDPTDGKCKQATCLLSQFGCDDGKRCGMEDGAWTCVEDTCADVTCGADEACRDGDCVGSCGKVTCPTGEKCVDGACTTDECATVQCLTNEVCDPKDGDCVLAGACRASGCSDGEVCEPVGGDCQEDPCLSTRCPYGEQCDTATGQCKARCVGGRVFCGDACVDPMADRTHCGATDDCMGSNAGEACADGLVCNVGECSESCTEGLVNCDGECIDPKIDQQHCGAKNECDGADRGKLCVTGFACMEGKCAAIAGVGGSGGGGGPDGPGAAADGARVIASGGGGCACSVPGATGEAQATTARGTWALALMALLVLGLARRRRPRAAWWLRRAAPLAVALLATTGGSGCKVDTFCLDCPIPGQSDEPDSGGDIDIPGRDDAGGIPNAGTGGGGGGTGGTGGTGGDGGPDEPDGGCVEGAQELCNSFDDDCDGEVDEDADLAGVDTDTDVQNCGGCGLVCALPHAFNECVDGGCRIDRDQGDNGCDVGFIDLDGDAKTGCEYQCTRFADDDSACNLLDDDCDGNADEDVDLETDPLNCDGCNFACPHPNADDGAVCEGGECSLDPTKCNTNFDDDPDPDFADIDGESANGCEYPCPVDVNGPELCNLADDDCDGEIDEGVNPAAGEDSTDPDVGDECGNTPTNDPDEGACEAGVKVCDTGVVICQGFDGPTAEVCDGLDNDCDGNTDGNDIPELGLPCYPPDPTNGPRVGSECSSGTLSIPGGGCAVNPGVEQALTCTNYQGPVTETCDGADNDCDGKIDEAVSGVKPGAGLDCINGPGGTILYGRPDEWVDGVTVCEMGTTDCSGGTIVCLGEIAPEAVEQCDALDHDCDGLPLNGYVFTSGIATTGPDPDLGDPCGTTDVGECTLGAWVCNQAMQGQQCQFPMGAQTSPVTETCDGKDNDCDGTVDDAPTDIGENCKFDSNGVMQRGPSVSALSPCVVGHTVCAAGNIACPDYVGPTAELCDNVDQDCDGVIKEVSYPTDARIGASCGDGNSTGVCTEGTQFCNETSAPVIACAGEVFGGAELCDGLDNDCDAADDDGAAEAWLGDPCSTNPDGSVDLTPSPLQGVCSLATPAQAQCLGGVMQCIGEPSPTLETCDTTVKGAPYTASKDQDCDGTVDEDFQLDINVSRCGTCSNDCTDDVANANMVCTAGTCDVASCKAGYYDDKTTLADDCSIVDCDVANLPGCCNYGGVEICDGEDNDCDGIADESIGGEPIQLPDPIFYCLQLGACASSAVQCVTHKVGDEGDLSCSGLGDPTCVTEPVCTIRPQPEICNAPYNQETNLAYDNDCDGVSDRIEFDLNAVCFAGGAVGACATQGNLACDLTTMAPSDTFCSNASGMPVVVGTPGSEATSNGCNDTDDDCDGDTDEACGLAGTSGSCVTDNWVQIPNGGGNTFIYAFEASRPDASSSDPGASDPCKDDADCASSEGVCIGWTGNPDLPDGACIRRACSNTGKRPWGNLTWDQAQVACGATHPDGRLCTEEEWLAACEVTTVASSCAWSFSANCSTFTGNESTCNGLDYGAGGDDLQATGSTGAAGGNTCSRAHTGGTVFDMSGNLKEYTDYGLDGTLPVRGGAHNNTSNGMRCNFDYTAWPDPDAAKFSNVGFRCCRGPVCRRYEQNTPQVTSAGTGTESTITVSGSGITTITSVSVYLEGSHSDIEDLDLLLLRAGAQQKTLVSLNNCNSDLNLPYALTFTDYAFATPTVSGSCGFVNTGLYSKPANALSFTGGADATWTLNVEQPRDDDNETNTIDRWALRICGN